ncbi:TPA: hypothetical protein DF272_00860 [Candidatus Falkowbacteria bacterium]|nr:hypothetical protein [Candidatus Falkowbacteria bacterium]
MAKSNNYSDRFQQKYCYSLTASIGRRFHPEFKPELTPPQMLKIGVFGGSYFIGVDGLIPSDLPRSWFRGVKLSPTGSKQAALNYFKVNASQPLSFWHRKGWIFKDDPHGWFQWYCRYYLGRRIPGEDDRQIKRWKAFTRHLGQIKANCRNGDHACRPRQRQALLHWAYDSRKI